jgi:hypothetical protein
MSIKPRQRAFLVGSHQAAVTGDIPSEDGSQSPFDTCFGHNDRPNRPKYRTEFMVENEECLLRQECPLWAKSGHLDLFDHLVGYRLNLPRNGEAERLRGLEIDH